MKISIKIKNYLIDQYFRPTAYLGLAINPFYIIRRGLLRAFETLASEISRGRLLDYGCGRKPYAALFDVDEYIGIDIKVSGHNHSSSRVDFYFDGTNIPFQDKYFDNVFSSEVFEHVFDIDVSLEEINRVLKSGGNLVFSCPFVWNEHEQPYDYARYTSFALKHLLEKHGFKLVRLIKTTTFIETIFQIFTLYLFENCMPKNKFLRYLLVPVVIFPIHTLGVFLSLFLPDNRSFFHNNVVHAVKL